MAAPENYRAATLPSNVGHVFGVSSPVCVDQPRIDQFAQCTGDTQWIHVDAARARAESPFGTTIAHGLLVLSLIPVAQYELGVYPPDARSVLNYGIDKARLQAKGFGSSKPSTGNDTPEGRQQNRRVELVKI